MLSHFIHFIVHCFHPIPDTSMIQTPLLLHIEIAIVLIKSTSNNDMKKYFLPIWIQCKMEVTTMAFLLSNSSSLVPVTTTTMSIIAPTSIPTTTTFTIPFLVTSMSHRVHNPNKASSSNKHYIKDFSPVTLSTEWSALARLLVLTCLSVIGSIGNVFMISSLMIEDHLKKAGEYKYMHWMRLLFRSQHLSNQFFLNFFILSRKVLPIANSFFPP